MKLTPPLFVALDVDSREQALKIVRETMDFVGGYKIGPRLSLQYGAQFVQEVANVKPVFIDSKFYDIPNTMESSVRAAFAMGASFCTVHAGSGEEALRRLASVEKELNKKRDFKILAVTVLTSFSNASIPPHWSSRGLDEQVIALAQLVLDCGLTGLVCSAEEVSILRKKFPHSYIVTPGIRFADEAKGDQKRVMGPKEAIQAGASAIVVGRPIVEAGDISKAAERYNLALATVM